MVGGAVGSEHVGGQGSGEGGGPEDQALCFVCVLPRVQCSRTPLGEPEWGSFAQNRGGGRPSPLPDGFYFADLPAIWPRKSV